MENLDSAANQFFDRREAMRPTRRTWAKHIALLLAALFTVTIAGVLEPFGKLPIFPDIADPQTSAEVVQLINSLPVLYLQLILDTIHRLVFDFETLTNGLKFSVSLLAILTAHEAGHYVACRLYKVDATLPYFIPLPPLIGPAGTLGAFIKIVSPLPSRRATFDIGVAGPIAGFIALIPVAVIGILTLKHTALPAHSSEEIGLYFAHPLLIQILANAFGVSADFTAFNPFLAAAWIGLLVTSLNLIPSGQLDGGHAIYALFGERIHRLTGKIAFAIMVFLSICGWYFYSSPSGLLFTILLGVMMKIRHPEPLDDAPLNFPRILIAVVTLLIFILSFVPFPVRVR